MEKTEKPKKELRFLFVGKAKDFKVKNLMVIKNETIQTAKSE